MCLICTTPTTAIRWKTRALPPTLMAMGEEGFNDEGQLEGESPILAIPLASNLPPPQLVTCREDHSTNPFTVDSTDYLPKQKTNSTVQRSHTSPD